MCWYASSNAVAFVLVSAYVSRFGEECVTRSYTCRVAFQCGLDMSRVGCTTTPYVRNVTCELWPLRSLSPLTDDV